MARRGIVGEELFCLETEDADIVLAIQDNELVDTELNGSNRGSSRRGQGDADSFLAKDVDDTRAELRLVGTNCEEGLNGIIC